MFILGWKSINSSEKNTDYKLFIDLKHSQLLCSVTNWRLWLVGVEYYPISWMFLLLVTH